MKSGTNTVTPASRSRVSQSRSGLPTRSPHTCAVTKMCLKSTPYPSAAGSRSSVSRSYLSKMKSGSCINSLPTVDSANFKTYVPKSGSSRPSRSGMSRSMAPSVSRSGGRTTHWSPVSKSAPGGKTTHWNPVTASGGIESQIPQVIVMAHQQPKKCGCCCWVALAICGLLLIWIVVECTGNGFLNKKPKAKPYVPVVYRYKCYKGSCDGVGFRTAAKLAAHKRAYHYPKVTQTKPTPKKKFVCSVCKKEFQTKRELDGHKRDFHSFKCPVCSKVFTTKRKLVEHQRSCRPAKRFRCLKCYVRFETERKLMEHQRNSSKCKEVLPEQPFKCSKCNEVLSTAWNLRRHTEHCWFKCERFKAGSYGNARFGSSRDCKLRPNLFATLDELQSHYGTSHRSWWYSTT